MIGLTAMTYIVELGSRSYLSDTLIPPQFPWDYQRLIRCAKEARDQDITSLYLLDLKLERPSSRLTWYARSLSERELAFTLATRTQCLTWFFALWGASQDELRRRLGALHAKALTWQNLETTTSLLEPHYRRGHTRKLCDYVISTNLRS